MLSDEVYRTCSQYRLFSFASEEVLGEHRKKNTENAGRVGDVDYLTPQEAVELVDYYVSKLWDFCHLFKVSSQVKVTPSN
jgi:predicted protein tyrosine phosphatase